MKRTKKLLKAVTITLVIAYLALCTGYYFFQQYFLFTHTTPSSYTYSFDRKFEERNIITRDGKKLNGLLFRADASKGLIFYLHGGGHTLDKWGKYAKTYVDLGYDIFMLDYRGFGKSEGRRPTEQQLYNDAQDAYSNLETSYNESQIVVLGYSLGTAPAAMVAANNHPKLLVLQAPYYSGSAAVKDNYPFLQAIIPSFLLRYKLRTYQFIEKVRSPVVILHGDNDKVFNVSQSYRLQKLFRPGDELVVLKGQGHNNFTENPAYILQLQRILSK